ncbi:MAG TPA: 1,6-anhydro-N-acetylmuramyl-L-alanine amidase AmpD [Burkholderiales bacterium]|jgi:AmpD protein|nr:1,6-anhydro-N-acetylmuramyl-L-alanine amidase AmpD [Burkholderiales bacterium]
MTVDPDGWCSGCRRIESANHDERPPGAEISLLVVHSISLPPGEYGGDSIERLFTNRLDAAAHPYFQAIAALRVSAHFLVRRDGELVQFVPVWRRAWHAGASTWRGRRRCNDFSLGIELEGVDTAPFEPGQYRALARLWRALRAPLPLRHVAAHSDIAPGRKSDPGRGFDWPRFLSLLSQR